MHVSLFSAVTYARYWTRTTILDENVGTSSKFSPPLTYNVDNQGMGLT